MKLKSTVVKNAECVKVWLEEEKQYYKKLRNMSSTLAERFPVFIKTGHQHILHKLAASLFREDVVNLYSQSVELKRIGSVLVTTLLKVEEHWEPYLNQIQRLDLKEHLIYRIKWFEDYILVFPIRKEFSFRRITLEGDIYKITSNSITVVETASELLRLMQLEDSTEYCNELDNSTSNCVLAHTYHDRWTNQMKEEASALRTPSLSNFIKRKKETDPEWNTLLFFEQLAVEGHHLHPGTKTKTGMSMEDVMRYSPEYHGQFSIHFLAVRRDYLLQVEMKPNQLERILEKQFEEGKKLLSAQGHNPSNYYILPVHEWQLNHTLYTLYSNEIRQNIIIPLPSIKISARATSSFRTVMPTKATNTFLKLAINSQMTSTVRSISTNTALNTVHFSNMVKEVLDKELSLRDFIPLNETSGFAFKSENKDKSRNLTVIVRENKEMELENGEIPVVGSSLYNKSPLTNKTILDDILEEYLSYYHYPRREGTIQFFQEYLSITIPGFLTFLTKYGIALEGHLQNSIPVFRNGKPVRFYFRDWGGARIYRPRLQSQGIFPDFYSGSLIETDAIYDIHTKAHYTIIQSHIGEIIRLLVESSGVEESEFWQAVDNKIEAVFQCLESSTEVNVKEDRTYFYQDKISHKALTKMRLNPSDGYMFSDIDNPLSASRKK
ncbi:IucA/IucC family protein [Bacillus sp. RO1]|uniref:IucA/IucC family protein n=1 Tax=Bacillus sp. RO1 TaxID=2722703 RepID=UPI001456F8D5|nr:IucA/IucC family protein [Bacillus sp. RO1]NLP52818.1 IucA/IucC family siderophore biosynthesis protein [Bacillus sp. RO1]